MHLILIKASGEQSSDKRHRGDSNTHKQSTVVPPGYCHSPGDFDLHIVAQQKHSSTRINILRNRHCSQIAKMVHSDIVLYARKHCTYSHQHRRRWRRRRRRRAAYGRQSAFSSSQKMTEKLLFSQRWQANAGAYFQLSLHEKHIICHIVALLPWDDDYFYNECKVIHIRGRRLLCDVSQHIAHNRIESKSVAVLLCYCYSVYAIKSNIRTHTHTLPPLHRLQSVPERRRLAEQWPELHMHCQRQRSNEWITLWCVP